MKKQKLKSRRSLRCLVKSRRKASLANIIQATVGLFNGRVVAEDKGREACEKAAEKILARTEQWNRLSTTVGYNDGSGYWRDLRKHKPEPGSRVLVCDEYGYVTIEHVDEVNNVHVGKMTWLQSWKFGNGTQLVAWMPLPKWPKELCCNDADGEML